MNKIFPLPEIEGSAYFSTRTNSIFLGGHVTNYVSRRVARVLFDRQTLGYEYSFEVHFRHGPQCKFRLALPRAIEFDCWLKNFGLQMTSVLVASESPVPTPTPAPTCPVCFGTGFYKGFGAPCSRGCP